MSVNKFLPHVFVIPEDRADEQIANGFVLHDQVSTTRIQVLPCADGWAGVLEKFKIEYIPYLRNFKEGFVVLLIDFDGRYERRRKAFDEVVPDDLKKRVFVVGAKETPEALRSALGKNSEEIGSVLAEECYQGSASLWCHDHLKHNEPDRQQLVQSIKPILFAN